MWQFVYYNPSRRVWPRSVENLAVEVQQVDQIAAIVRMSVETPSIDFIVQTYRATQSAQPRG